MLLYITAEDIVGGPPERRGVRPLHRIPDTLTGLYDLGLRHHLRGAAMLWPADDGFEAVPDWRLDRLSIRIALYGREKAGVEPGERVVVFGRLGWLWPVVDFGAMGFGAVPVGIEHDLPDAGLAQVLGEVRPRLIYATDPRSAERAAGLARDGGVGGATIVADGLEAADGILPLRRLLDDGSILDTAERAQSFRAVSRQIDPAREALRHVGREGQVRLTHAEAMGRIEPVLRARPAQEGDVAYVGGPRVDLPMRLTLAAFVGDGLTTAALGRDGRVDHDVASLRPHKMVVPGDWLEAATRGQGPRWPGGLDRPWVRRRLLGRLGGRLRWAEARSAVGAPTARGLGAAGVTLHVSTDGAQAAPEESRSVH